MPDSSRIAKSDIEIRILRSNRKSVIGRVLPDCNIEVRAPFSMTTDEINKWLDKYEPKFLPVVRQCREMKACLAEHSFGYGGQALFRGEWIPVKKAEDDNHGYMALMKNGAVVMKPDLYEADMRHHIKNLFSALAEPIFEEKLYRYSDSMGVWSKAWTIGNARKRHGSCDSNGKITFSWRIVMMSDDVMDYIIVHELAHLKRMNHSKAFSDEVAAVLSDWKERRSAHRKYSHMLRCGGWM